MRRDRRPREHHQVIGVRVLRTIGHNDRATHTVAEHDTRQIRVLGGRDFGQGTKVVDELRHVAHPHSLAAGPSVAAVVKGVGQQTGRAEAARDMVIAPGVLAVAVREHHYPARFGVRGPYVVDDPDPADAGERSLRVAGHRPRAQVVINPSHLRSSQTRSPASP